MARVYVGTYRKYNEGSINGGWLDLADYPSYNDFLGACHRLHKDESDPEFMIQDNEGFPDGLDCMEWMSEDEFNEVKKAMSEEKSNYTIVQYSEKSFVVKGDTRPIKDELKRLGGLWFKKECGWLFSNKKREAVEAFLGGAPVAEKEDNGYYETLKEFCTQLKEIDRKYYMKEYVGAVKIQGKYYLIEKPHINNRFCFRDEGADYEYYKELMDDKEKRLAEYFKSENLSEFDRHIEKITKGEYGDTRVWWSPCQKYNRMEVCFYSSFGQPNGYTEFTEDEKQVILNALRYGRSLFEKRLDTYLKRYGVSKIHTWTYWADA